MWSDGYWPDGYWNSEYWSETGGGGSGNVYWSGDYWATDYWAPDYWPDGGITPPSQPVQSFTKRYDDSSKRPEQGAGGAPLSYWHLDRENLAVLMMVMEADEIL